MPGLDSYILLALIAVPFLGGLSLVFVPSREVYAIRVIAVGLSLLLLGLSAYVFLAYDSDVGGYQFAADYEWLPAPGIKLLLGVDGISVPMVLLTGIVTFTGGLISWNIESRPKDFFVLFFLLVAGVFGVFVSLDLFFFFFFYEIAVLPMYLLIGVWGSSSDFGSFLRPKEYGAMKLMIYLVAGSVLVWVGIIALYVEAGLDTFSLLRLGGEVFLQDSKLSFSHSSWLALEFWLAFGRSIPGLRMAMLRLLPRLVCFTLACL